MPEVVDQEPSGRSNFLRPFSFEAVAALVVTLGIFALDQADIHIMALSWLSVVVCISLVVDAIRRTGWASDARRGRRRLIGGSIATVLMFAAFGVFLSVHTTKHPELSLPNESVSPIFAATYNSYGKQLGAPTSGPQLSESVYQGVYEHATVLWTKELLTLYVLPTDGAGKPWKLYHDSDIETDPKWWTDEFVAKELNLPNTCSPPSGGIASRWSRDRDEWKSIGCRRWQYAYSSKVVTFQHFQNGLLIGPLRISTVVEDGENFVLLAGGLWYSEEAHVKAARHDTGGLRQPI